METIVTVTAFCSLVLLIVVLFAYVVLSRRKKAFKLYQAASREESRGNYTEAIALFESYLREKKSDSDEKQNIQQRIKTLQSLNPTFNEMPA